MIPLKELQSYFTTKLSQYQYPSEPKRLYEPVDYIMQLGGKRIRPVLVLAAYNLFSETIDKAFEAALALEVFHNFSLLHDDIMDEANIRRGQETVHLKYDENTAILSGDVMMILSYQILESYEENYLLLTKLFSQTAREVCEGQMMDMQFESTTDVTISDYLKMIELKTSVLIGAALGMGAIIGKANEDDQKHLFEFGRNMGIAFQIQDDLLDTFGTEELLGKKIGGDIAQKKKTYLYLKALDLLSDTQKDHLCTIYNDDSIEMDDENIAIVKELLTKSHVKVHAEELKLVYQQLALSHLAAISVSEDRKSTLKEIAEYLLTREV